MFGEAQTKKSVEVTRILKDLLGAILEGNQEWAAEIGKMLMGYYKRKEATTSGKSLKLSHTCLFAHVQFCLIL